MQLLVHGDSGKRGRRIDRMGRVATRDKTLGHICRRPRDCGWEIDPNNGASGIWHGRESAMRQSPPVGHSGASGSALRAIGSASASLPRRARSRRRRTRRGAPTRRALRHARDPRSRGWRHNSRGDNLDPVSRAYYAFWTMLCTPNALSQGGELALGAQAGHTRLRKALTRPVASPACAVPPRPRSTSCSKAAPELSRAIGHCCSHVQTSPGRSG